jgi:hypothetical protein
VASKAPRPTRAAVKKAVRALVLELDDRGLLLMHDPRLPCATALIAGEPISGSWWGHQKGELIYEALGRLDGTRVAWPKLLGGKVTLLHRSLWPSLISAARSGAEWQRAGLGADARALLARLAKSETLRSDALRLPPGSRKIGAIVSELEARLLIYSESEHTEAGHHSRALVPYQLWQRQKGITDRELPPPAAALDALEEAAARALGERVLERLLPWKTARRARPTRGTAVKSRRQ